MTIEILGQRTYTIEPTGETFRHAKIIIESGVDSYLWNVGGLPAAGDLQVILDAREAELLAATIAAGVTPNTEETTEHRDFYSLIPVINNELAWIEGARADIVTGKGVVGNPGSTLAQTKAVVNGLLDIVDRVLIEQQRELKAWRNVIRRLD